MDKITVVIPTNRFLCVEKIIKDCIIPYHGELFQFEIHDSSINNNIEVIISKLSILDKNKIKYKRYRTDISADDKAMLAIKEVTTNFFWLMGDGNLVNYNQFEKILLCENFEEFDLINVDIDNRRGHLNQDSKYKLNILYKEIDYMKYCQKYFSRLTYWGSQIIRTDFYKEAFLNGIIYKYQKKQIPWWIAFSLLELINIFKNDSLNLGVIYTNFISYNPQKKDHWWTHDERYYIYVFEKMNEGFSVLPSSFKSIEYKTISFFRRDALVSNSYLLFLRSINNLNFRLIYKYKKSIDIINGDYLRLKLYCLLPVFVAKIGNNLKKCLKYIINYI
ncbi:hypothetical protein [Veillonella sp. R32]|uniref:hypothetical protein n=1 Tax=Veillonella sp. R32 TaxID=2021312 RepID=UPI00138A5DB3|nr:hypothetical protein [Veillonella sp. R32]KAF1680113.1 hypothetical protein VER_08740 [Veillonella sp. R32]